MRILAAFTLFITLSALALWRVTGGDSYTKFEVIREVAQPLDPSDPLVQAGFYDAGSTTAVRERQFRLGLLPTPSHVLDKHALSVATIVVPMWGAAVGVALVRRRKRRA